VIHEHDDLVLASAAIDFVLSDDEADRLRRAIADCPVCAERTAAYRSQFRMLADLPAIEPSDALRRRVRAAALTGRQPRAGVPVLLLAAALAIGAVLALLAVVAGGAFKPRTIAEYPPIDEPTSPVASVIALASPSPDTTSRPSAGPGAGPVELAQETVAEVISTNLRLRSQPRIADDSIKFEPFLTDGDRLFIVDGPVVATNHDWYQVAAWRPSDPTATWPIGWVATADINGTPWIAPAGMTCPAAPTVEVLARMSRYDALACYRETTISFRAFVSGSAPRDPCPGDPAAVCLGGPTWLAGIGGWTATPDAGDPSGSGQPTLAFARDPAGPVGDADAPPGRMVRIEGRYDHPASSSCAIEGAPVSVSTLTVTDAVLRCRSTFVATAAVPDSAFLSVDAAAVTTTPGLRVRSLPVVDDASIRYEPLLDEGTRLFVLGGPVIGSGYDWYRVLAPTVTRSGGQPMIGWVAVASKTGEIWAQDVPLACPSVDGPIDIADLARLGSGVPGDGGASCFGDVPITTTATVTLTCTGPDASATGSAGWLARPAGMTMRLTEDAAAIDARVHPDLAGRLSCDQPAGRWVATGHFADPGASECGAGAASDDAAELARYRCRSIFVVTDVSPAA
jgi:hypothetical protein